MKTYYVKVRGNIFKNHFVDGCQYQNWSVWKIKIRFRKKMKNLELVFAHSWYTSEDQVPDYVNGIKVMSDWELDCEIQEQSRLKW